MQPDPIPAASTREPVARGVEPTNASGRVLEYRSTMRDPLHFIAHVIGPALLIAFVTLMAVASADPVIFLGAAAVTALYGLSGSVARRCDVVAATFTAGRLEWWTAHTSGSWTVDEMSFTPPRFPGALPRISCDGADRYLRLRPGAGLVAMLERVDSEIRGRTPDLPTPDVARRIS